MPSDCGTRSPQKVKTKLQRIFLKGKDLSAMINARFNKATLSFRQKKNEAGYMIDRPPHLINDQ